MIYDRGPLQICSLSGGAALRGTLTPVSRHLYTELEVYHRRYWEAVQAESQIDRMARFPFGLDIDAGLYAILEDGHVYKILQAQHGTDEDGLPCCTLSLMRKEANYDIAAAD